MKGSLLSQSFSPSLSLSLSLSFSLSLTFHKIRITAERRARSDREMNGTKEQPFRSYLFSPLFDSVDLMFRLFFPPRDGIRTRRTCDSGHAEDRSTRGTVSHCRQLASARACRHPSSPLQCATVLDEDYCSGALIFLWHHTSPTTPAHFIKQIDRMAHRIPAKACKRGPDIRLIGHPLFPLWTSPRTSAL
ncbi:uncharacterized protein LOC131540336 isoform X2 [Onychostoma macrolepis]|uniref:uncharacterized protein LOC131540336 isoform X2 n=1 Tax=Onychostoma macrolepis TaxID=369639 RepID=UPI00272A0BAA|nr:uncharacterized protein LOC131540336 isoform X2 [Onychostoma macrolepis]